VGPCTLDGLFQRLFPAIRAKCARMLGDREEAADIAQETFLRLCATPLARGTPEAQLAWVYRTSTRLAIDFLRRRRLGVEVPAGEGEVDPAGGGPSAEAALGARQWLLHLAGTLPEDELAVVVMTRFDEMTQDEVAAVAEISPRSVRRILARFDAHLARVTRRLA
jgi:RNA polymerase sigma-70 factor (ECF subfamily)